MKNPFYKTESDIDWEHKVKPHHNQDPYRSDGEVSWIDTLMLLWLPLVVFLLLVCIVIYFAS